MCILHTIIILSLDFCSIFTSGVKQGLTDSCLFLCSLCVVIDGCKEWRQFPVSFFFLSTKYFGMPYVVGRAKPHRFVGICVHGSSKMKKKKRHRFFSLFFPSVVEMSQQLKCVLKKRLKWLTKDLKPSTSKGEIIFKDIFFIMFISIFFFFLLLLRVYCFLFFLILSCLWWILSTIHPKFVFFYFFFFFFHLYFSFAIYLFRCFWLGIIFDFRICIC